MNTTNTPKAEKTATTHATKAENKAETRRIRMLATSIQQVLERRTSTDGFDTCTAADLLKLAEYADTLAALVLHEDTEIRVFE